MSQNMQKKQIVIKRFIFIYKFKILKKIQFNTMKSKLRAWYKASFMDIHNT